MTEEQQNIIFQQWIGQYKSLIFKVVRAYAFTPMDRDDLFQEIAIQCWRSVPGFRSESSVTTWLYRISLNTAIKWSTKERKHRDPKESVERLEAILKESKEQVDERLDWLYEEISKLDEIDRSITLLLLEDFSYREMSGIIGMTESNIGVRINRIKKHLVTKSKNYNHNGI